MEVNVQFNKPKGFGEILDYTFRLSKNRFSDFFLIFLFLIGPLYLLEAIILLISGTSFFRETGTGGVWYEEIISRLETTAYTGSSNIGIDIGYIIIIFASLVLLPVAQAAILLAVNHIRNNEEYTIGSVIKKAFTRFWPLFGSTILFCLIVFGIILIPAIIGFLVGIIGFESNPILSILLGVILFLGFAVGFVYLMTRWSFYFGSVTLKEGTPGFLRSWRLTRKRTWVIIGLYIIFTLIISSISGAIELSFTMFLGSSVLVTMIVNLVTLLTTMIFSVGYAVMYFDLKIRHDADDLKDMIEDYTL
nr:hypothetical protein [Metabacillus rhizolycopersici]